MIQSRGSIKIHYQQKLLLSNMYNSPLGNSMGVVAEKETRKRIRYFILS